MAAGLPAMGMAFALFMVMLGALIQGSIGSGFAFATTPTMALILPEAVPATLLILSLPLAALMAVRERRAIDGREFAWITVGRLPGTLLGAWLLIVVSTGSISVVSGLLILLSVAMSTRCGGIKAHTKTQLAGGMDSGIMGTAAGMGSPPLALVYQERPREEIRSTLALSFVVGIVVSLLVLTLLGRVEPWHLLFALGLSPSVLLGLWLSNRVRTMVDRRWMRPAILGFATVASLAAIIKGVIG